MKNAIRVFSKSSSIKEDVLVDEDGKQFICMEVGKMKYCTTLDRPSFGKTEPSSIKK